jgi:hypothetical protein
VGRAIHATAIAKDIQPADGSVRTRRHHVDTYYDWMLHNGYFIMAAQTAAARFVETFKEFPPVQKPGSFTIDDAMAKMSDVTAGAS